MSAIASISLLAAVPSAGAQTDQPSPPPAESQCGTATVATRGTAGLSTADVVRTKGVGCKAARQVVRRCISHERVEGWKPGVFDYDTSLRQGDRRIWFHMVSGPPAMCAGLLKTARNTGLFGPFQEPNAYPDKWPPPFNLVLEWPSPVMTYSAYIRARAVSTVDIYGIVRAGPTVRSVWFEYGTTRDLGAATEKQPPPAGAEGTRTTFNGHLVHLKAKTRYFWQAVANVDDGNGGVTTVRGALGSFVTNPYPKIADPSDPCASIPSGGSDELFELTESLAIACDPWSGQKYNITKGACFPACSDFYHGSISCSKDFPRNLNSGSWSFPIPKIGYQVSVNELASYWRSNDSNRFITWLPGKNANSPGGEVGPIPGYHEWDVAQWAYPFTSTSTDIGFWINCTEKWGTVINGDALAQGQGTDAPSTQPPGVPQNLKVTKASDGGFDATWQAPGDGSPSGIAGYYVGYQAWQAGAPKTFAPNQITPVIATGTSGHVSPGMINAVRKTTPASWEFGVAVGAISREGTIGTPAVATSP